MSSQSSLSLPLFPTSCCFRFHPTLFLIISLLCFSSRAFFPSLPHPALCAVICLSPSGVSLLPSRGFLSPLVCLHECLLAGVCRPPPFAALRSPPSGHRRGGPATGGWRARVRGVWGAGAPLGSSGIKIGVAGGAGGGAAGGGVCWCCCPDAAARASPCLARLRLRLQQDPLGSPPRPPRPPRCLL